MPGPTDALFYQYRLVVRELLGRKCSFIPSCSRYGQRAISRYGPVLGTMMALERWTRCHSSARRQDYYVPSGENSKLLDPIEDYGGFETWDSLLLPF
ncbi:membrane protein insertion efficiency factor YidD [Candidatus Fermentibacteria bacterium]|nr:membrane protein insertion efficiency factor YidD [Candidatus Fermentibacteria bacterium]